MAIPLIGSRRRWKTPWYIKLHAICVFLYAVLGRGFAYLGYKPLFVGEALLLIGCRAAIKTGKLSDLGHSTLGLILILFSLWGLCCTLPFVSTYGTDAFRDAMLWGYSLFAWITAALVLRSPSIIDTFLGIYRKHLGWLVTLIVLAMLATSFLSPILPTWPGTDVSIPSVKVGDMSVHLAGAFAFLIAGLTDRHRWWFIPAIAGVLIGGSGNRGGFLACAGAVALALFLFPRLSRIMPAIAGVVLAVVLASVLDLQIRIQNSPRVISARQLSTNVMSVFGSAESDDTGGLQGTKQWRLDWWNKIVGYTFQGPYFWRGKGYGINLTVSDNIGRNEETFKGLRSPHNSHMTLLARSGVPGATLWLALQLTWFSLMLRRCLAAKRDSRFVRAGFFAWLLAYWLAFLINASFDVSLEGPVPAIPFWTIFGLGWAASISHKATPRRGTFQLEPAQAPTLKYPIAQTLPSTESVHTRATLG